MQKKERPKKTPVHLPSNTAEYSPKLNESELAKTISMLGIKKANNKGWQLFLLGILAGFYISVGGHLFMVAMEQGMGRLVAGAAFSAGLIMVVIAGAELFTGNVIMIIGAISTQFPVSKLLKNWLIVYIGNFIGAYLFTLLIYGSGLMGSAGHLNALGALAVKIADAKLALPFDEALIRGILCNIMVLLAIIMAVIAKDVISKMVCCMVPIMAFVASGWEHCIANMYLIPIGLFMKGEGIISHYVLFANIVPVTLGNILGGILILLVHPNRIRQLIKLLADKNIIKKRTADSI